jgi:hypothetical protein
MTFGRMTLSKSTLSIIINLQMSNSVRRYGQHYYPERHHADFGYAERQ